jgi:hypothetical protein
MTQAWCALLALIVLGSHAPVDLDAEEKAYVGSCIDKLLNAKSDRIRRAAEDALVSMGADIIDELSAKSGDAAWKALEKICPRIGQQASAERLEALAKSAKDSGRKSKLSALAATLRSTVPGSSVDPDLAAKVNAILAPLRTANSFGSSDPAVGKLVELGRPAVPVLLSHLRPGVRLGMAGSAISYALPQMVEAEDLPLLRASLVRGNSEVAAAVGKLLQGGAKEALAALHEAVERGVFGWEVARALQGSPEPADTVRVVTQWFKAHPNAIEHEVAAAAELLGLLGAFDSTEAMAPWIAKARDAQTVYHLGKALAALGDARAIPLLIRIVANEGFGTGHSGNWNRSQAAKELNSISGKSLDVGDDQGGGAPSPDLEKRLAEAAKEYKEWYESVKGKLSFDRSTREWKVK